MYSAGGFSFVIVSVYLQIVCVSNCNVTEIFVT